MNVGGPRNLRIWLAALALAALARPGHAASRHVRDFGAVPGDGRDDAPAIQEAMAACEDGDTLVFDEGRYDLWSGFKLPRRNGLTVDGRGCTLMMRGFDRETGRGAFPLFDGSGCSNLTLRNYTVDMDPLAHMAGKVVAVGLGEFELEVFEDFLPITGKEACENMMDFFPDKTPNGRVFSWVPGRIGAAKDSRITIRSPKTEALAPGGLVRIQHARELPPVHSLTDCRDVAVRDVNVYAGGTGVLAFRSEGLAFERYKCTLRPGSGRLMSISLDNHFNMCMGSLTFKDCEMIGGDDDGVNIHSMYARVVSTDPANNKLVVEGAKKESKAPGGMNATVYPDYARAGERLVFLDRKIHPVGTARVKSFRADGATAGITLDALPEGVEPGQILDNMSCWPQVRMAGCKLGMNRARGFLCNVPNVTIEDSEFRHVTGPGIWVVSDTHFWYEGGPAGNVVIRNNKVIGCNKGETFRSGAIQVACEWSGWEEYGPAGILDNIVVEGNEVSDTGASGIFIASASNVVVRDNRVGGFGKLADLKPRIGRYGIFIQNTANVLIAGNRSEGGSQAVGELNCTNVTRGDP